jgi:hypothetical protein
MAVRHTTINGSQKVWLARVAYPGAGSQRRRERPTGQGVPHEGGGPPRRGRAAARAPGGAGVSWAWMAL